MQQHKIDVIQLDLHILGVLININELFTETSQQTQLRQSLFHSVLAEIDFSLNFIPCNALQSIPMMITTSPSREESD